MSDVRAPLMDRFGRRHNYLRISITDRCNFRCAYCMPNEDMEWTPRSHILTFEEIERLTRLFASMGVDKVRLTGGEPTTRRGLVELVGSLGKVPGLDWLTMTTNGDALSSMAVSLKQAGIQGVNISLDSLRPDRFFEITRRNRLDRVLQGIDAALAAGFQSVKINVVAMAGANEDELCDFVEYFWDKPIHIRFIEFMPFQSNGWNKGSLIPYREMKSLIEERYSLVPLAPEPSAVAKEFSVQGGNVQVGFITSMTEHFCGDCNRIRLTADGQLKVCLFAKSGVSLRDMLRSGAGDDEIAQAVRNELNGKWAGHPAMDQLVQVNDRPMIAIGG